MSYILDALRKADAQRERSRAPGLHDQPLGAGGDTPAQRPAPPWLAGGALALGVVAIGVLAWSLASRSSTVPASVAVPAPVTMAAEPQAAAVAAPASPAVPPATVVLPAPLPAPTVPPPAAAPAVQRPVPAARAAAPASAATAPVAAAPAAMTAVAPRAAEPASSPPPGAPRVSISGGVWSSDPAQRMLLAGGQVVTEGAELAPGLLLEQVRQGNRAVLVWQGQRFIVGW